MSYRELMRMKLLEDVYNKMSDEEKRTFAQILLQQKDNGERKDRTGKLTFFQTLAQTF